MSELLRLQEETKKMLRSVLLPNKEGLLLSGNPQAVASNHWDETSMQILRESSLAWSAILYPGEGLAI